MLPSNPPHAALRSDVVHMCEGIEGRKREGGREEEEREKDKMHISI